MVRTNILLAMVLLTCALGLVTSQHRARVLFVELERTQAQAARHEVRWNQLQLEQTALAKASLIDAKARRELAMQSITPERTLYLLFDPAERVARVGAPLPEAQASARHAGERAHSLADR